MDRIGYSAPSLPVNGNVAPKQVGIPKGLQSNALNNGNSTAATATVDRNDTSPEARNWNRLQDKEAAMLDGRANVNGVKASSQSKSGLLGEVRDTTSGTLRKAALAKFGQAGVDALDKKAEKRTDQWELAYMPENDIKDKGDRNEQLDVEKARVYGVALGDEKSLNSAADVASAAELNRRLGAAKDTKSSKPKQDRPAILADDQCYHTSIADLAMAAAKARQPVVAAKTVAPSRRNEAFDW